jgi:uncharacterized protein YfaS (alpha-2-macroglobulin family)
VLRTDTPAGIALLAAGTPVAIVVKDTQGREVDKRTVALSAWSSAEWTMKLADGPLGRYEVTAAVAGTGDPVSGNFLVAAYRRPDFRVDVNLAGESSIAGVGLDGRGRRAVPLRRHDGRARRALDAVAHSALRRAARGGRRVLRRSGTRCSTRRTPDRFQAGREALQEHEAVLGADGQLTLDLTTDLHAGRPYQYTLRRRGHRRLAQTIAGRAAFRVDPAPWYIGLRRPPFFVAMAEGADTEIVAADLAGHAAPGSWSTSR